MQHGSSVRRKGGYWRPLALALLGATIGLDSQQGSAAEERREFAQVLMGMDFKLTFYAADEAAAKQAADAAFARVAELNSVMSDYDPNSELSRLSQTAGQNRWVNLSDDLWRVLSRSQELARQTDGAFDVTVGPLVRLWRRSKRERELPTAARLAEAKAATGYTLLELDPQTRSARLAKPGMRLDLGGIGAGYAVDAALAILKQRGFSRAMVDASGDIACGDPPPGQTGWKIGLDVDGTGAATRYVSLANRAVTTAGDASQFVEIGGARYSHIVDSRTGLGLTHGYGVAIIADDCVTADSLDTAASALGPRRGLKFLQSVSNVEGLLVPRPGSGQPVLETRGFAKFELK